MPLGQPARRRRYMKSEEPTRVPVSKSFSAFVHFNRQPNMVD
jgi:hypothetical protein